MAEMIRKLLGRFVNTEKPAKYLIVPLVPSRTPDLRVDARPIEGDRRPSVILGGFSVGLEWDEVVPTGAGVDLVALFERSEPIVLEQGAQWFGEEEMFDVLGADEPREFAAALHATERQRLETEYAKDPNPIDGVTRGLAYRRFFKDLDYATHPSLLKIYLDQAEADRRCEQMYYVSWLLWNRIAEWKDAAALPPDHDLFGENAGNVINSSIEELSGLQREIYEEHFMTPPSGGSPGVMRWDWVGEAFDLFAAGHLKDPSEFFNYGPDSVNFFLFGEFGRVAGERGYDRDFWAELLGHFTRAQRIFLKTYTDSATDQLIYPFTSEAKLDSNEITNVRNSYVNVGGQQLMQKLQVNIQSAYDAGMKRNIICDHVLDD